jgi:hypothetical protein
MNAGLGGNDHLRKAHVEDECGTFQVVIYCVVIHLGIL